MQQRGFTLVELSIVLVILGLLIGGVLTGQTLIRAAELRSVTTQQARYVTAIQTFRDKYFALPGDMTNATAYWGAATCDLTTANTGTATCNGDGNGQINYSGATVNESFQFWRHLANAGLIEGSYDGITHGSFQYSQTTANSPIGRMSGSFWYALYGGTASAGTNLFYGQYGHFFQFGTLLSGKDSEAPILKPEETYNIDTKIDDGRPATGNMVIRNSLTNIGACTDTTDPTNMAANYLLSSSVIGCALIFRNAF